MPEADDKHLFKIDSGDDADKWYMLLNGDEHLEFRKRIFHARSLGPGFLGWRRSYMGMQLLAESPTATFGIWAAMRRRRIAVTARPERLLMSLGSLVPRKVREPILGDLAEDVAEYRLAGWTDRRLCVHVTYQIAIAFLHRFPWVRVGLVAGIGAVVRRFTA